MSTLPPLEKFLRTGGLSPFKFKFETPSTSEDFIKYSEYQDPLHKCPIENFLATVLVTSHPFARRFLCVQFLAV